MAAELAGATPAALQLLASILSQHPGSLPWKLSPCTQWRAPLAPLPSSCTLELGPLHQHWARVVAIFPAVVVMASQFQARSKIFLSMAIDLSVM